MKSYLVKTFDTIDEVTVIADTVEISEGAVLTFLNQIEGEEYEIVYAFAPGAWKTVRETKES